MSAAPTLFEDHHKLIHVNSSMNDVLCSVQSLVVSEMNVMFETFADSKSKDRIRLLLNVVLILGNVIGASRTHGASVDVVTSMILNAPADHDLAEELKNTAELVKLKLNSKHPNL